MGSENSPENTRSDAGQRPSRSTPDLIFDLHLQAMLITVAAIAVVHNDVTNFVFANDGNPLDRLNILVRAGGHPIGLVGAQIGREAVEYHAQVFVEYQDDPRAMAYLQTLRTPFLALLRTHVDRMPDNPRLN